MATTIQEALRKGELRTDPESYAFLRLPPSRWAEAASLVGSATQDDGSFRGLLLDHDEITVMLPARACEGFLASREAAAVGVAEASYRLITFDAVLDPNLVGFMHAVTGALAAEGISVLPFAAYSRDHIFVQEQDLEAALEALRRLKRDQE